MALQFQPGQLAGLLPGIISGYGGGTFNPGRGRLEQVPNNPQQMPQAAPEPKKKGLFSKDGTGWKILGVIGDALQTAGGGQGTYGPALAKLQEQVAEEKRFQQRLQAQAEQRRLDREAALEDRKEILDYQRENPMPDSFARALAGAGINPESEEGRALYRQRAEMLTNPVQLVPDGMGGYAAVRPNEAASGGLQPGHTEDGYTFLGGDPGDPNSWRQGGGVGGGTGMFP